MRRFLLIAHRVPVRGEFTLNDLAGGAGRMDEVARVVSTLFTLSNDLRRDVEATVLFVAEKPPAARRIDLVGRKLRYLNPDERSTAALLKNALVRGATAPGPVESSPGLTVGPVDPAAALGEFLRLPGALWLAEDGAPLDGWTPDGQEIAAFLSDPYDPTSEELDLLRKSGVPRISVGPKVLRSSQVVDVFQRELDLREARSPKEPAG
jgi:tRNA (pseudouridine54-N1)-methyltransferase